MDFTEEERYIINKSYPLMKRYNVAEIIEGGNQNLTDEDVARLNKMCPLFKNSTVGNILGGEAGSRLSQKEIDLLNKLAPLFRKFDLGTKVSELNNITLLGWWKLEDFSAEIGNDFTVVGAAPSYKAAKWNNGLVPEGTTQLSAIINPLSIGSIGIWSKPDINGVTNANASMMLWNSSTGKAFFIKFQQSDSDAARLRLYYGTAFSGQDGVDDFTPNNIIAGINSMHHYGINFEVGQPLEVKVDNGISYFTTFTLVDPIDSVGVFSDNAFGQGYGKDTIYDNVKIYDTKKTDWQSDIDAE